MTTKLCFVDTETTGLDPRIHDIWELAVIVRQPVEDKGYQDVEFTWQFAVDLDMADPMALKVGRFYERYNPSENYWKVDQRKDAIEIAQLMDGAHLVANVPSFDDAMLKKWLRKNGATETWHYHLVCVENLIAGLLSIPPPWDSKELSKEIGIDIENYDRHTALGDARWTRDMYDRVMTGSMSFAKVKRDES